MTANLCQSAARFLPRAPNCHSIARARRSPRVGVHYSETPDIIDEMELIPAPRLCFNVARRLRGDGGRNQRAFCLAARARARGACNARRVGVETCPALHKARCTGATGGIVLSHCVRENRRFFLAASVSLSFSPSHFLCRAQLGANERASKTGSVARETPSSIYVRKLSAVPQRTDIKDTPGTLFTRWMHKRKNM